jgi:hypothetical protein
MLGGVQVAGAVHDQAAAGMAMGGDDGDMDGTVGVPGVHIDAVQTGGCLVRDNRAGAGREHGRALTGERRATAGGDE